MEKTVIVLWMSRESYLLVDTASNMIKTWKTSMSFNDLIAIKDALFSILSHTCAGAVNPEGQYKKLTASDTKTLIMAAQEFHCSTFCFNRCEAQPSPWLLRL
jgi:hypothetical protein